MKKAIYFLSLFVLVLLPACSEKEDKTIDNINDCAYNERYKSLSKAEMLSRKILSFDNVSDESRAEAYNNLAFVNIQKMRYREASLLLDTVQLITHNQIELLIADVQRMRLAQRMSESKDFYKLTDRAEKRLKRIKEELNQLTERQYRRVVFAESEMAIVQSAYYYYVGLDEKSRESLLQMHEIDNFENDTSVWLAYLYNVGSGGIINDDVGVSKRKLFSNQAQEEFDYLMRCFLISQHGGYHYWTANALQAISEHLQNPEQRDRLIKNNLPAMKYLNPDNMPDSLLAGYLAQRAEKIFLDYGDVYQSAGASRTLATCFWLIGDNTSSLICLENALERDTLIKQAPDLVASIHEQLSVVYASINDKPASDYHRNIYLDMQERTRQDRYLESRADTLKSSLLRQNIMIASVIVSIVVVLALLFIFYKMRRKRENKENKLNELLIPLQQWTKNTTEAQKQQREYTELLNEDLLVIKKKTEANLIKNIEQRAKITLAESVLPLINRMVNVIEREKEANAKGQISEDRRDYILEINERIIAINNLLTQWIQLDKGNINVHIESFKLQELFEIVGKASLSFQMKGIELAIEKTADVVKADKVLTLFMINTLVDNARKFTEEGGKVTIKSNSTDDYVEVSVIDNGCGMSQTEVENLFDSSNKITEGHGFGLINSRGIIAKYKSLSRTFDVATLGAESKKGEGSRFFFRLPKGIIRTIVAAICFMQTAFCAGKTDNDVLRHADSLYMMNIKGNYQQALNYSDSAIIELNRIYKANNPNAHDTLSFNDFSNNEVPAELLWWRNGLKADYRLILEIRNEDAVASLALHDWQRYKYNNDIYTQLYKEMSVDKTLENYVKLTEKSTTNRRIAIVLLILILLAILPAYYFIYYRHYIYNKFCVETIDGINSHLLAESSDEEKLKEVEKVDTTKLPSQFRRIVVDIKNALSWSIKNKQNIEERNEQVEDEINKAEMELNRLHLNNCCLSNSLSALKHETMYYPAKIEQIMKENVEIKVVEELTNYYQTLYYSLLKPIERFRESKEQCGSFYIDEIGVSDKFNFTTNKKYEEIKLLGNKTAIRLLFDTLAHYTENPNSNVVMTIIDKEYVSLVVKLNVALPQNVELLCHQILRDMGDITHKRRCGFIKMSTDNEETIKMILARGKTT